MKFDELLENHVGSMGRFQIMVMALTFYEEACLAAQVMLAVFIAASPDHWCVPDADSFPLSSSPINCSHAGQMALTMPWKEDPKTGALYTDTCRLLIGNDSLVTDDVIETVCQLESSTNISYLMPYGYRNESKDCSRWEYSQAGQESTIVTEWDLVCSRAWLASLVASVFLGGRALGNFVFGWMADRFGRKIIILGCGVANLLCAGICAASPNYTVFIIMRFLHSAFATGKTNMGFVMSIEYTSTRRRVAVGSWYMVAFAVGYMLLAPVAYFIRDWRYLLMAITIPEVPYYVLVYFFLPESPRWLYLKERYDEADKIVHQMARINKTSVPEKLDITEKVDTTSRSPLDLVRTPNLRVVSIVLLYLWGANGFVYYGLSFNSSNLAGNVYLNFLIMGAIEIPAQFMTIYIMKRFGSVWPFAMCMFIGGIAVLLTIPIPAHLGWLEVVFASIGKFFITSSFTVAWIYTVEVYPTCVRSLGLGVISLSARIASPVSPFILLLDTYHHALPAVIFGVTALIGAGLCFLLPETKNKPMTQTITEGEDFIRGNRVCCKTKNKSSYEVNGNVGANEEEKRIFLDSQLQKMNEIA